ncbi:hypothetical protein [Roseovarius sp. D22-M7]|uniref:hypothetical protein n=1 Tax=Roseovarius sp. D22-M7 TaxID=3127116 RepID=UPI00300FCBBE
MKRFYILTFITGFMAACAITPEATMMSRETGATGTGVLENVAFGNSGPMNVSFKNQNFTGQWVAVRNPGSTSFGLLSTYGIGGFGVGSAVTQSDSGYGTALLSSNTGDSMRCEFRYSLVTITATGVCQKQDGEIFDLQVG